jgi:uncharacterized protein YcsI (UPF0317 family)
MTDAFLETRKQLQHATGADVRRRAREGQLRIPTAGLALGRVQANLVIVPQEHAWDFLLFCQRNPKPCPLLDVTEPGSPQPKLVAADADLRTDLPQYRVYRDGSLSAEPHDLLSLWQPNFVSFLLGCSFTFENALLQAGLPLRHIESACNVPMYRTNIPCQPSGPFQGTMVVSMRPLSPPQTIRAVEICSRFPRAHGTPLHFGDPAAIGIKDINHPDYGDSVEIRSGELPVFWACGVTPQWVAQQARLPFLITHKPGYMFVTDWMDTELEG